VNFLISRITVCHLVIDLIFLTNGLLKTNQGTDSQLYKYQRSKYIKKEEEKLLEKVEFIYKDK
jgi:hypothetical protein